MGDTLVWFSVSLAGSLDMDSMVLVICGLAIALLVVALFIFLVMHRRQVGLTLRIDS